MCIPAPPPLFPHLLHLSPTFYPLYLVPLPPPRFFFCLLPPLPSALSPTHTRAQAEKISPNDLAVFDDEALPNQWSRRVHALERIADRVAVTNRFPAYAEYTSDDRHRHLFQVCGCKR